MVAEVVILRWNKMITVRAVLVRLLIALANELQVKLFFNNLTCNSISQAK